jgi:hypothetical protein
MTRNEILELRTRKRIAKLWGVEPFRIDVYVDPDKSMLSATLDGKTPDANKRELLERDIIEMTQAARKRMN